MTSSTTRTGMYFDRDIQMAAVALIEMFGDETPARVGERIADMKQRENEEGLRFWQAIAEEVSRRL